MPLLICSYVTNITMFQDPSRRKEGMNLKQMERKLKICPKQVILVLFGSLLRQCVFTLYKKLWVLLVSPW